MFPTNSNRPINSIHLSLHFSLLIWIEIVEKQLELVARADGTVRVFGQILVADESNVCIVKFLNTAVSYFFCVVSCSLIE